MKIYFAGSIRGGRDDRDLYLEIINLLKKHGTVLTEHVGDKNLTHNGEDLEASYIYQRDMNWIVEADVLVVEVSTPSLGVGYELGKSESKKPILCLYRNREERGLSAMIAGNKNLKVETYQDISDVEKILEDFFTKLS